MEELGEQVQDMVAAISAMAAEATSAVAVGEIRLHCSVVDYYIRVINCLTCSHIRWFH